MVMNQDVMIEDLPTLDVVNNEGNQEHVGKDFSPFRALVVDLDAQQDQQQTEWPRTKIDLTKPQQIIALTPEQVEDLAVQLEEMTLKESGEGLREVVCPENFSSIIGKAVAKLNWEPTLLELTGLKPETQVIIVGDTHGQFHDVRKMFKRVGAPSANRIWVLNGDFIDRGSWGAEELLYLCALKLAYPLHIYLLRGNHESSFCSTYYGFKSELLAKYGKQAKDVYKACRKLFTSLPLACLVEGATLVLHGGLFRKPPQQKGSGGKAKKRQRTSLNSARDTFELGSLEDLRAASKGNQDPLNTSAKDRLASDVLWSDPVMEPGLRFNAGREIGCVFGPDMTERFLQENGIRCVIRSHEGPDARAHREDKMPDMLQGWTLDHDTKAGQLFTCFSAPDYPQFQDVPPEERYRNKAAVAVLTAPRWDTPQFWTFSEGLRPSNIDAYYDYLDGNETGDDMMANLSEGSEMTVGSVGGSGLEDEDEDGGDVDVTPGPGPAAAVADHEGPGE